MALTLSQMFGQFEGLSPKWSLAQSVKPKQWRTGSGKTSVEAKMDEDLIANTARNLGMEDSVVRQVVDEFLLQLHRRLHEYRGLNGDYVGEELHYQIGPQGFYHLLGFLDTFTERYRWEPGTANEYLLRLGSRADWAPYGHQMEGWSDSRRKQVDDGE